MPSDIGIVLVKVLAKYCEGRSESGGGAWVWSGRHLAKKNVLIQDSLVNRQRNSVFVINNMATI